MGFGPLVDQSRARDRYDRLKLDNCRKNQGKLPRETDSFRPKPLVDQGPSEGQAEIYILVLVEFEAACRPRPLRDYFRKPLATTLIL